MAMISQRQGAAATAMLGLWLVNAGFIQWRAGWTVGPRYLGAAPPFFAFGALLLLERLSGGGPTRRSVARGLAGGLALASVITIGTVGLSYDTLPDTIGRPFAQFTVPLVRTGFTGHHLGDWFGWESPAPWFLALAALVAAPIIAAIYGPKLRGALGEGGGPALRAAARAGTFVVAFGAAMVPAFTEPEDATPLFVLHPSTQGFVPIWQPAGRDRIARLRVEAERYGPRRPCMWYRIADLERIVGQELQARSDEARARGAPRERCPKVLF